LLEFEHLADRLVFADYLAEGTAAGERAKRLDGALRQCAETSAEIRRDWVARMAQDLGCLPRRDTARGNRLAVAWRNS